jgi:hypothetical protein
MPGYIIAYITPQGVVRESAPRYSAEPTVLHLSGSYNPGDKCPICDKRGADSLFAGFTVRPHKRAVFGSCDHSVEVKA